MRFAVFVQLIRTQRVGLVCFLVSSSFIFVVKVSGLVYCLRLKKAAVCVPNREERENKDVCDGHGSFPVCSCDQ
ncbi:MAG: hypothetical protein J3R72DRAFT_129772 [Linnemannia gamsii]|nr:MAG: hypothetical protein J3R72DRAFT_129772 [Linnemannia gamsii]